MKVSEFDYELPEELIAQTPIKKRDESRLMVLDKENKKIALAIKDRCNQRFNLDLNVILVDMEGNYLNDNFII